MTCVTIHEAKRKKNTTKEGTQSIFPHHITITGILVAITAVTKEGETGNEENLLF